MADNDHPAQMPPIPTPEIDKQLDVARTGNSQAIGEFLEWLDGHGMIIAQYQRVDGYHDEMLQPANISRERLIATHFGINLDLVEKERRALLEAIREQT